MLCKRLYYIPILSLTRRTAKCYSVITYSRAPRNAMKACGSEQQYTGVRWLRPTTMFSHRHTADSGQRGPFTFTQTIKNISHVPLSFASHSFHASSFHSSFTHASSSSYLLVSNDCVNGNTNTVGIWQNVYRALQQVEYSIHTANNSFSKYLSL